MDELIPSIKWNIIGISGRMDWRKPCNDNVDIN
jgi:hypothetical protein